MKESSVFDSERPPNTELFWRNYAEKKNLKRDVTAAWMPRDFGGTILSVSHDRKYLSEVCDAVYELRPGGLHRIEPPE